MHTTTKNRIFNKHFVSDLYLEQTYAYFDMLYYMAEGLINILYLLILNITFIADKVTWVIKKKIKKL